MRRARSETVVDAPIKVSRECKDLIRYGSATLGLTQGEFVERAVATDLVNHGDEIREKIEYMVALADKLGSSPVSDEGC